MKVGQRILEPDAEISIWQSQRMKPVRDAIANNEGSISVNGTLVHHTLKISVGVTAHVHIGLCVWQYVRWHVRDNVVVFSRCRFDCASSQNRVDAKQ